MGYPPPLCPIWFALLCPIRPVRMSDFSRVLLGRTAAKRFSSASFPHRGLRALGGTEPAVARIADASELMLGGVLVPLGRALCYLSDVVADRGLASVAQHAQSTVTR